MAVVGCEVGEEVGVGFVYVADVGRKRLMIMSVTHLFFLYGPGSYERERDLTRGTSKSGH